MKELTNPQLFQSPSDGSPLDGGLTQIEKTDGESIKIDKVSDLFRFVNLNTLGGPEVYEVEIYRSNIDETRDFDVFEPCDNQ